MEPQIERIVGRDDISVSVGQRMTAKSVDHLTTSAFAIVDLKYIVYHEENINFFKFS